MVNITNIHDPTSDKDYLKNCTAKSMQGNNIIIKVKDDLEISITRPMQNKSEMIKIILEGYSEKPITKSIDRVNYAATTVSCISKMKGYSKNMLDKFKSATDSNIPKMKVYSKDMLIKFKNATDSSIPKM